jgi:hypothetical protein
MSLEHWEQHIKGNISYKEYVSLTRKDLRERITLAKDEIKDLKKSIATEPLAIPKDSVRELNEAQAELINLKSKLDSYKGI